MEIRTANIDDLEAIAYVERTCFPEAEAASEKSMEERLTAFADHFWLLCDGNTLASYVGGMVTDEPDLSDAMYADAGMHREDGAWQMIFSVCTLPEYQRQGLAALLLNRVIEDAKAQGRKGVVLTCKERLIHYYAKFGFVNEGMSESEHGNAVWYQMRIKF